MMRAQQLWLSATPGCRKRIARAESFERVEVGATNTAKAWRRLHYTGKARYLSIKKTNPTHD
jgi:hypothetical protein